ncbi:MAG: fumarylacetoacetate hydrolase family protein [Deltaproteobacteria bacterium]|nr:fumarylacetoacetate hydrolase family protein [Deltaproteobacteria bacterium]
MRLSRFLCQGVAQPRSRYGIVDDDAVTEATGDIESGFRKGEERYRLDEVKLLPPCVPSKIIAIGLNYKAHASEFNKVLPEEPMIFMKPPTAVIGHGDEIVYPAHMSRRVDFEGELAVVIGREARMVSEDEAGEYILGYTCFNDVTARDLQKTDKQYARAKGFDTFAPMGPWIETDLDPLDVRIESYLNGEKRQDTSTADMIFNTYRIVSFVSLIMTLLPGDVIATGTPSGVGKMKPGNTVEIRIEGVGSLVNRVA